MNEMLTIVAPLPGSTSHLRVLRLGTAPRPVSGLALAAATSATALLATGAILSAIAGTATSLAAAPGAPEPLAQPEPAPS
jgi:hypothetical protein